jgi:methionyl-tRNA formyltransferase
MHVGAESGIEAGVMRAVGEEMAVGCGGSVGAVVFDEVQMEGRRRMSAAEFLRGFQVRSGERLGL